VRALVSARRIEARLRACVADLARKVKRARSALKHFLRKAWQELFHGVEAALKQNVRLAHLHRARSLVFVACRIHGILLKDDDFGKRAR